MSIPAVASSTVYSEPLLEKFTLFTNPVIVISVPRACPRASRMVMEALIWTEITTSSVSVAPSSSVTVREKPQLVVSVTVGTTKLALAVAAPVSVTVEPEVCSQR